MRLLPILRNVVAGLRGLDPAVIEAADGVGMTAGQRLRLVEAPLAAPVVMAGIRTATVWTIGAATLATTVGAASLGNLIFAGLQTENWALVLAGCVASAALALAADALLALVERGLARRERWSLAVGRRLAWRWGCCSPAHRWSAAGGPTVVIGAKNFSEQFILARLIGTRLEARRLCGRAIARVWARRWRSRALRQGDIDVYVEYSGTIWTDAMHRAKPAPRAETLAGIDAFLKPARLLGPLGFENAYALAMKRRRPRGSASTICAASPRSRRRCASGPISNFSSRPEWRAVRDGYGLRFAASRAYAPSFMYRALESGQADVISAFSSRRTDRGGRSRRAGRSRACAAGL